jgi:hypothetical protein
MNFDFTNETHPKTGKFTDIQFNYIYYLDFEINTIGTFPDHKHVLIQTKEPSTVQ